MLWTHNRMERVLIKNNLTIEQEINAFFESWDVQQLTDFMNDIIPLCDLYNVDEENDWVRDEVGEEDLVNVRLIRTVYLLSRIAELHSGKLCSMKIDFKNLYKRMEKERI